jgi:hypothetical protein
MATTNEHHDQHRTTTFPSRIGDHAPNLATLDELRSRGRNPLLTPAIRGRRPRPVSPGCTAR